MLEVGWAQAFAWRMRRHQLDPIGDLPIDEVVRRLSGVQAQGRLVGRACRPPARS